MPEIDIFSRLAAAIAIGLLVGMERGWKARDMDDHGRAAGLRTFGLAGMMGGVSGLLSKEIGVVIVGIAFLGFTAALCLFAWMESRVTKDVSATTVVAGMVTFLLGAMAVVGEITVAIALAVAMTVLLALRNQLHTWLFKLTWPEIKAGLILLVMSFLLLPLLPNQPIDPLDAVNLRHVWILAIIMALISFCGYVAVRMFGDTWGIAVTAAAGGLASSTATTLAFARLGQEQPHSAKLLAGGILISGAVMTSRVWAIAVALNPNLLLPLVPLGVGTLVLGAASMLFLGLRFHKVAPDGAGQSGSELLIANPLEVWTSIKLALLIAVIMLTVAGVQHVWGNAGVLSVAAISGVMDVDAIALSMARLKADLPLATIAILIAVSVNTLSKAAIASWIGGRAIGMRVSLASLAGIAAMVLAHVSLT